MSVLNQIINFKKHPVNKSTDYFDDCKEKLQKNSVLQLDDFLLPDS